ncbi:MAG: dienelactone hydrolase family protein [SAR86 cluster bacterium]|nr:dienelactone hydrolase family protein [SAR86 cluster bacterium]
MKTETVNYQAKNIDLKGYVAFPDAENAPLVLIVHTWAGKDEFVHQRAEDLAALGYVGFAVDMYGNGKVGADTAENESLMTPLVSDRDMLKDRIVSALNYGKSLPGVDSSRAAAIGYCFGGLVVLDLARSGEDLSGVVSFHGLLMPSDISEKGIKAKVLVLHGERDPMVPLDMVDTFQKEMTEAEADWQLHSYGGTYHAFTNPDANDPNLGTQFNKSANDRSWQSMKNFFAEIF